MAKLYSGLDKQCHQSEKRARKNIGGVSESADREQKEERNGR